YSAPDLHKISIIHGAEFMTFFRMKLRPHNISAPHRRSEIMSVLSRSQDVGFMITPDIVRMDKIKSRLAVHILEDAVALSNRNRIPTHVRDLKIRLRSIKLEFHSLTINPAKPGQIALFASFSQQLHSQTDTQNGNSIFKGLAI